MATLADHPNVYNTALALLERKGYQLWHDGESNLYYAEKNGWDFASGSPVALLGLVAIFEAQQPEGFREYWWRIDEPKLYRHLRATPKEYVPVYRKGKRDPDGGG